MAAAGVSLGRAADAAHDNDRTGWKTPGQDSPFVTSTVCTLGRRRQLTPQPGWAIAMITITIISTVGTSFAKR